MRNQRSLLFLGFSLGCGLLAALVVRGYVSVLKGQKGQPTEREETVSVIVAAEDLAAGTRLVPSQLSAIQWPKAHAPKAALRDAAALQGRVLRKGVAREQPIFEDFLLSEGAASGLQAVIGDRYRAVSVKVDAVVGVAGFVMPGSRVDVLVTLQSEQERFSNVILQDVRVLAVDQSVEEDQGSPTVVNVVTLEVTPEQAKRLTYASSEGKLQLALRRPGDETYLDASRPVEAADLVGAASDRHRSGPSIRVIKGTSIQNYVLGSETDGWVASKPVTDDGEAVRARSAPEEVVDPSWLDSHSLLNQWLR